MSNFKNQMTKEAQNINYKKDNKNTKKEKIYDLEELI